MMLSASIDFLVRPSVSFQSRLVFTVVSRERFLDLAGSAPRHPSARSDQRERRPASLAVALLVAWPGGLVDAWTGFLRATWLAVQVASPTQRRRFASLSTSIDKACRYAANIRREDNAQSRLRARRAADGVMVAFIQRWHNRYRAS
jgi:hypothetical protein